MTETYIHGFSEAEQERLVHQARVLAPHVFGGIDFSDVRTVLEIGCAVGAELRVMRERWPHLNLTGLDRSEDQVAAAQRLLAEDIDQGIAHLVQGDAHDLPLPSGTFDRVITVWTLEHIPNTETLLREAFRVLADSGKLILTEVDNETFGFEPGCEAIGEWWRQFSRCQLDAGGDPYVGRGLAGLARRIGSRDVAEETLRIIDSRNEPNRRVELLDYLEDLLMSGADAMKQGGYVDAKLEAEVKADFRRARLDADIQFQYHAVRVTCSRPKDLVSS